MWWEIIKNQLTTSQLGSTMDWENEEIPDEEEEDDNCRKKLLEIYLRANNIILPNVVSLIAGNYPRYTPKEKLLMQELPEEQACMILEKFKNNKKFETSPPYKEDFFLATRKNIFDDYRDSYSMKTAIEFHIGSLTYQVIVVLLKEEQNEETKRHYIELCREIFGTEYYNSTYEKVFGNS